MLSYFLFYTVLGLFSFYEINRTNSSYDKKFSMFLFFIFSFLFIFLGASRFETGVDYFNYLEIYQHGDDFFLGRYEPGFKFLIKLSAVILKINYYQFIFIFAFIAILLKCLFFNKYFENPIFLLFLYFPAFFLVQDCGQIRQGMAISFTLLSIPYMYNKKLLWFLVLNFIAVSFHYSAIIFILAYLLNFIDLTKRKTFITFFLIALFSLAVNLPEIFLKIIGKVEFSGITSLLIGTINQYQKDFSLLHMFLGLAFLMRMYIIVIYFNKKAVIEKDNPFLWYIFNIYLAGVILFILFNTITAISVRGLYYFKILDIFLLASYYKYIKFKNSKIFYFGFLFAYGLLRIYSEINSHYNEYIPYKSILLDPYHYFF